MRREKEEREGERRVQNRGKGIQGASQGNKGEVSGPPPAVTRRGGSYKDKVPTVSFFVSNFLEEVSMGDLYKLFLKFGRVWEVFIPKKLDRWGRRFAFIKFREVVDVVELEESLKEVWWGNLKLKVNLSRFDREVKGGHNIPATKKVAVVGKHVVAETSYLNVVEGRSPVEAPFLEFLPDEVLLKELQNAMVGRLMYHLEVDALQTCLFMEGWSGIKVVPLGEKLVMLKEDRQGVIAKAREAKKAWWSETFTEVVPWSPNIVATSRRTWVQLRGIPLHIWKEDFFKKVGVFIWYFH